MSRRTWVTRTDVLKDLGQINGRNERNTLDLFVVEGDGAPPIRHEIEDEDEMQYHFGPGYNTTTQVEADNGPDLKGISLMLQMVNDLEDVPDSDEPTTIFRDSTTDEISISKLNPNVSEFVPSGGRPPKSSSHGNKLKSPKKIDSEPMCSSTANELKTPRKIDSVPMFIRKRDKVRGSKENVSTSNAIKKESENTIIDKTQPEEQNSSFMKVHTSSAGTSSSTINSNPKRKIEKVVLDNTSISTELTSMSISQNPSLNEKSEVTEMKAADIDLLKREVRTKILMSSKDSSVKKKSERNVAMATLMKLCAAPPAASAAIEPHLKLVTPQYFKASPDKENADISNEIKEPVNKVSAQASTSTCSKDLINERQYVDPLVEESISKVNDWFNQSNSPKPKLPAPPVPSQNGLTFKKKFASSTSVLSVNSPTANSETSSEKKKSCDNFCPSEYAKELLSKYKKNAETKIAPKEDLGTMLERKLKERDQEIKKKWLEKKNGTIH